MNRRKFKLPAKAIRERDAVEAAYEAATNRALREAGVTGGMAFGAHAPWRAADIGPTTVTVLGDGIREVAVPVSYICEALPREYVRMNPITGRWRVRGEFEEHSAA